MQITFTTTDGRTESIEIAESLSVAELKGFIEAMLGVNANEQVLVVNGRPLPSSGTLASTGLKDRDLVMVMTQADAPGTHSAAPPSVPAASGGETGATSSSGSTGASGPVFWEGMGVDDVMANNTNPEHIVDIIQKNPRILQELNFHNPKLAEALRKDRSTAVSELRMFMMFNATTSTMDKLTTQKKEKDMEQRLQLNPMDEEANKYFGEKIREQQVMESYTNMMQNYPESMARVLMLYIEVEINGVSLQAFVDSGAQTSVISGRCAEKCNIARLTDSRFAGQVVGVGTGRTLGRVHVVDIKIEGNYFPISLTVMDDSQGLGDTNMEFLLGLDMLKRHRCSIDLAQGKLFFHGAAGMVSTPFLHEKDLPESKGGTKDYNPNALPKTDDSSGSSSS